MFNMENDFLRRVPLNSESINFNEWIIGYEKSHILKSICSKGQNAVCERGTENCCELCTYRYALQLPHLPDMVFHKNKLMLTHRNGAKLEFVPMDALRLVENGKQPLEIACAQEWRESRLAQHREEKFKPFDWTFTSPYQGSLNDKIRIEPTNETINKIKLMAREHILFYQDLTLFEDELHDNGISSLSVKIRVMPSGFFILLRHFLRVDSVCIKMHDTRFHFEIENDYILKEYTHRESTYEELENAPKGYFTIPNEIEYYLTVKEQQTFKLYFK